MLEIDNQKMFEVWHILFNLISLIYLGLFVNDVSQFSCFSENLFPLLTYTLPYKTWFHIETFYTNSPPKNLVVTKILINKLQKMTKIVAQKLNRSIIKQFPESKFSQSSRHFIFIADNMTWKFRKVLLKIPTAKLYRGLFRLPTSNCPDSSRNPIKFIANKLS